jgi:hypothetical protein
MLNKTAFLILIFSFMTLAIQNNLLVADSKLIVSTLSLVNGHVKIKKSNGKIIEATRDMDLSEGEMIKTENASFVRLIFIDKSTVTIGPNSLFKVTSYSKTEPGILTLFKGSIRAQVTKDYMDLEDKNKSKLFIRTKSAAMGIRGTDFQVTYNKELDTTELLTIEGKVALNKVPEELQSKNINQKDLDQILEKTERIMVTNGFVSKIVKDSKRPLDLLKIESNRLEFLHKETVPKEESKEILDKRTSIKEPNRPVNKEDIKDTIKDSTNKKEKLEDLKDRRPPSSLPKK